MKNKGLFAAVIIVLLFTAAVNYGFGAPAQVAKVMTRDEMLSRIKESWQATKKF